MLTKSLALRILIVNVTLIVLPLIIYFFFLFQGQYTNALETDINRFQSLAFSRMELVEEMIGNQYNTLNMIAELLDLRNPDSANTSGLSHYRNVTFYERGTKLPPYAERAKEAGEGIYFTPNELFISRAIYSLKDYQFVGVLTTHFPIPLLLDEIANSNYIMENETTSLLDTRHQVVASDDPNYKNILVKNLKPVIDYVYSWTPNKETKFAVIMPIKGTSFFLMSDFDKRDISDYYQAHLGETFTLIALLALIASFLTLAISQFLSRSLKHLVQVMDKVSQGDLSARYQNELLGFEINETGEVFNQMLAQLIAKTTEAQTEHIKTETVAKELKIGHDIQASILPHNTPRFEGIDIAGFSVPAREVGGDFYDIYPIDGRPFITVADTSGKGILACLYSLCLRSMLRSFSSEYLDLTKVLAETNSLFHFDLQNSNLIVQAFVATWDNKTKTLDYASAGPSFGFIISHTGTYESLSGSQNIMGALPHSQFNSYHSTLNEGDVVVLYTRGSIETENLEGELYGEHHLKKIAMSNKLLSAREIGLAIARDMNQFAAGATRQDDATIVVLKAGDHV